jgi:hypothetical protein
MPRKVNFLLTDEEAAVFDEILKRVKDRTGGFAPLTAVIKGLMGFPRYRDLIRAEDRARMEKLK